ncbi:MAG: endopeptidase La [Clostridiales bacterium]|nr:endopeptidase La [Candidatus Blautia equi]
MRTVPIYNLILLPDVTLHFKKDVYENTPNADITEGEDILFLMMKEPKLKEAVVTDDFYPVGITAVVERIDDDGNLKVRTRGRVTVNCVELENGSLQAEAVNRPETVDLTEEEQKERFEKIREDYLHFVQRFQWGILARGYILNYRNINEFACSSTGLASLSWAEKYEIIAQDSMKARYDLIEEKVREIIEMAKISDEADQEEESDQEKRYREHAIKKKIAYLQKELDDMHPENVSDIRKYELAIEESGMNDIARKEAEKVLNRLKQEGPDSHEYGMLCDYLDFVTTLSWKKQEYKPIDLEKAEQILNEDHYGLKKVKERIIQQLAVMALNKKQSGSILLFAGAPGTGKTSVGQSIAKALGREYVRISLGGIRDEAEIRGHRRTYVGAMAGRIMEAVRRSGVSNPVIVLDEVDKLVHDHSGDPAGALLEVLDPEQNNNFTDHYMNVPYDLSDVMFICTANYIDYIPDPLFNRMEYIEFPSYTPTDKFHIARKHLIPQAKAASGIPAKDLKISDAAIRRIIMDYTMESGVRGLKKRMDKLCRTAAVKYIKEAKAISVTGKNLTTFLGRTPIYPDKKIKHPVPGMVNGLAWTPYGGTITVVETRLVPGRGGLILTGSIGEVMRESVQIAWTLAKAALSAEEYDRIKDKDLHVHFPDGATPKDGPSAGITIFLAAASLLDNMIINPDFAMTGEISLQGRVMPIGGLPEKLMAAQRAGIKKVLIPFDNVPDLEDVPEEVKESLKIIPLKTLKDLFKVKDLAKPAPEPAAKPEEKPEEEPAEGSTEKAAEEPAEGTAEKAAEELKENTAENTVKK